MQREKIIKKFQFFLDFFSSSLFDQIYSLDDEDRKKEDEEEAFNNTHAISKKSECIELGNENNKNQQQTQELR